MIHNAFQKATWDASADARALRGKASLSADMKARLNKALSFAVQPVMESIKKGNGQGRILDVGSGTGALIPEIVRLGIPAKCILGIDISPGMTRVASGAYPDVTFVTNDFLNFIPENGQLFDSILFCMAIHDLPDPLASINHALKLLRSGGGRIVISHPRGASHVVMQHRANPVMVPHLLPSQEELESLICSQSAEAVVNLLLPPNLPNDERDKTEGYLCVIEKI
jgi:SAM-dependent methyltransferase